MKGRRISHSDRETAAGLRALSSVVIEGNLCGHSFPDFVRAPREAHGSEPSGEALELARYVAAEMVEGRHATSGQIAYWLWARAEELDPL
jgi:hypothetical protein